MEMPEGEGIIGNSLKLVRAIAVLSTLSEHCN